MSIAAPITSPDEMRFSASISMQELAGNGRAVINRLLGLEIGGCANSVMPMLSHTQDNVIGDSASCGTG